MVQDFDCGSNADVLADGFIDGPHAAFTDLLHQAIVSDDLADHTKLAIEALSCRVPRHGPWFQCPTTRHTPTKLFYFWGLSYGTATQGRVSVPMRNGRT